MALVITNGEYYAVPNRNGRVNKTNDITEAQVFSNVNTAAEKLKKHRGYLKGYYVWHTEGETMQPKRIRIKRKHFSQEVRKLLYQKAEGKCALCGKKITFDENSFSSVTTFLLIDQYTNRCYNENEERLFQSERTIKSWEHLE